MEEKARLLVLDTIGCVLAVSEKAEPRAIAPRLAKFDPGNCMVPVFVARLPQARRRN